MAPSQDDEVKLPLTGFEADDHDVSGDSDGALAKKGRTDARSCGRTDARGRNVIDVSKAVGAQKIQEIKNILSSLKIT